MTKGLLKTTIIASCLGVAFWLSAAPEKKFAPEGRDAISKEALDVLENGEEFTLLSIDPERWDQKVTNNFCGHLILGKVTIKNPKDRRAILDALYAGIWNPDVLAGCFNPRHGIQARKGNQVEDLLICFECGQIRLQGASKGGLQVKSTPAATFNRILSAAHVPISKAW